MTLCNGLCISCDARDEYKVTDNTDTFTLSFEYVVPSDVNVAIRDSSNNFQTVPRSRWVFENLTTIKITPPPQADVVIYRCTDVSQPQATFFPGNSIKADDLNANQRQLLNAIEELRCTIANLTVCGGGGDGGCSTDSDCAPGEVCYEGECRQSCSVTSDCPPGQICINGVCLPACSTDNDCPDGQVCVDGDCYIPCDVTSDCPEGFVCENGICVPAETGEAPIDGRLYGRQDRVWKLAIPTDFTTITELPLPSDEPPEEETPETLNENNETDKISTDAPSDGKYYGRINGTWAPAHLNDTSLLSNLPVVGGGGTVEPDENTNGNFNISTVSVPEGPVDGTMYGRKDADWDSILQHNISQLNSLSGGTNTNED